MKVWILQTGEPTHLDDHELRPMRAMNLSDSLIKKGHDVTLWTSAFYHTTKEHRSEEFKKIKINDRLEIRLIPSMGYQENISFRRILDHFQLALNLQLLLNKEDEVPDVAVVGYPPIETAYVMVKWLKRFKIPVVIDIKDLWPELFVELSPKPIRPLIRFFLYPYFLISKKTIKNATSITSMSKSFLKSSRKLSKREVSKKDRVFPLTSPIKTCSKESLLKAKLWWEKMGVDDKNKKNRFVFIGTMNSAFDFKPVYHAMKEAITKKQKFEFILCGQGPKYNYLSNMMNEFEGILFPGWIDRPKIEVLSSLSRASLAPYKNINNFKNNIPNKILDSLALGLPIVTGLSGEVKNLIDQYNIGLVYGSNHSDLYLSLNFLVEEDDAHQRMAMNAKKIYTEKFSFEKVYNSFVDYLEQL